MTSQPSKNVHTIHTPTRTTVSTSTSETGSLQHKTSRLTASADHHAAYRHARLLYTPQPYHPCKRRNYNIQLQRLHGAQHGLLDHNEHQPILLEDRHACSFKVRPVSLTPLGLPLLSLCIRY